MRGVNRGSASAKRVQHDIAFIGARRDDSLQKGLRLLRRVAKALLCRLIDAVDVSPNVTYHDLPLCWFKRLVIAAAWESSSFADLRPMDEAPRIPFVQLLVVGPVP